MEETPEGLAKAAATREAAKRKRSELEEKGIVDGQPVTKKVTAAPQAILHEVALPKDFVSERDSEPEIYGLRAKLRVYRMLLLKTPRTYMLATAGSLQQPQYKGKMAKKYPFTLDPFQSTSIACLVGHLYFTIT